MYADSTEAATKRSDSDRRVKNPLSRGKRLNQTRRLWEKNSTRLYFFSHSLAENFLYEKKNSRILLEEVWGKSGSVGIFSQTKKQVDISYRPVKIPTGLYYFLRLE